MENTIIDLNTLKTDAYRASFLSKNYKIIGNYDGFFRNSNDVVLFYDKNIKNYYNYGKVRLNHVSQEFVADLKNSYKILSKSKFQSILCKLDLEYFSTSGKNNKEKRNVINKYERNIPLIIQDSYKSIEDVIIFLNKWKSMKKDKYRMMFVGLDINFIQNYLTKFKKELITKFYYHGSELVGLTIIEKVNDNLYNLLIRKADPEYPQLTYYIDYSSFREIVLENNQSIIINLGIDSGDIGIREYKLNKFPIYQLIDTYNIQISFNKKKGNNLMNSKFKKTELTPIEYVNNMYFKREDYYKPFEDLKDLGGSKVRQLQMFIESKINDNKFPYKGIMTYSQVTSIQSLIVAKIAHDFGIPCVIGIGVKNDKLTKSIEDNNVLNLSKEFDAEIISLSGIGYNNVLESVAKDYSEKHNLFLVNFGINSENDIYGVIRGIAFQVQNLPDDLDNLIVPCGSGVSLAAILVGLKLFNKKVKRVIGIQISGYDRRKEINKIISKFNIKPNYEFFIDKTYSYNKKVEYLVSDNFDLSKVYESKAFEFLQKNKTLLNITDNEKTLFWVIGNNNFIYKPKQSNYQEVNIKISDFIQEVNPCDVNMITNHCYAQCCRGTYKKLDQPVVIVLDDEEKNLIPESQILNFTIDKNRHLLVTDNRKCPYQDSTSNLCSIHLTGKKPFGCSIMPITITKGEIAIQKIFTKMKCQVKSFEGVNKVPFYKGYRQSMVALFGEEETQRIIQEIESEKTKITARIPSLQIEKMRAVKKAIKNIFSNK
jgi:1-aminocyclopropane-1-carboxylate deaminase/D-cysteine desulfhydrase-like pyridoxal-dependent ACC family enzyme/Fe-S-cluster containining protein